jgi:hypothetical protein
LSVFVSAIWRFLVFADSTRPLDIHGPKISFYRNIFRQNVSCE